MECRLCYEDKETRNINLYVNGSEGLQLCHACEMSVVNTIREIQSAVARAKLVLIKNQQQVRDAKKRALEEAAASTMFVDSIQGSNCAEWRCGACGAEWASPSLLPCPKCPSASSKDSSETQSQSV